MLRIGVIMYQTSLTKGQELVAQRMVKEFGRQGHEAFLITSVYHDWEPIVSIEEVRRRGGYVHIFDENLGIPVIRVNSESTTWPPRRISFLDFMSVLSTIVEDLKLNVLITHSSLWNGPEEVVKFVEWRRNLVEGGSPHRPLIFCHMNHLQEPSDEWYSIYERTYREAWNNVSLSQIIKNADLVLVTTPLEEEFMEKLGARDEQCLLFPGGIEDEALESLGEPRNFRDKYRIPGGVRIISFLGTIEERKNVLSLLEAAKLLSGRKNIHFAIAGRVEGEYGDKVREEAAKLRNVSLLGQISGEEKAELIRISFLNITMSRAEALGLSQLEFMSAGVPVITSGVGGQSWIVRNGANGVVLKGPDDVKGASEAIMRLVEHSSLRRKLGKRAAHFASGFSITRLIHQLSKRLEQMLQNFPDDVVKQGMQREERVVEAWVSRGLRVVATTQRLIIASVEDGKQVVAIPYNEILKIVHDVKAHWLVLVVGVGATLLLLASRLLNSPIEIFLRAIIQNMVSGYGLAVSTTLLIRLLRFLPLAVSITAFLLTLNGGFTVFYGTSKKIFLPKAFLKALRLADKLTPNDLFVDETERVEVHR